MLVGHDVPVVFCADGNTRAFWCMAFAALGNCIRYLPEIRSDLSLNPFAGIIVPFMTPAYAHASILLSLKLFELIVALRQVFSSFLLLGRFLCYRSFLFCSL